MSAGAQRRRRRRWNRLCVELLCATGLLCAARASAQAPIRILLAIGQDVGAADDEPLRYAERDARRIADLFTTLGDVEAKRTYLLTNASAEDVRRTVAEIRGRSIELGDVIFIAYVSSHADSNGLHLGNSRLPYAELRALIASVPARLRLLITDACTSGALIRSKGGKLIKPFAIDLESGHDIAGQVVITSAGSSEPAQEWEALAGSLFTHHLISGLRGAADRDGDGRVTLFEAYSYSYERTLAASTGANAGAQHPAHEIDLRGEGDMVLTRPGGRSSGLGLAAPLSGRYIVTSMIGGELIAEVDKVAGRAVRLALDPGRYLVRKPEGAFVRVGELLVLPNGLSQLDEGDMEQVPYAEVARRGAGPTRNWSAELALGVHSGVVEGAGATPSLGLALQRERGPWAYALGVELGGVDFAAHGLGVEQRELWGQAEVRLRWPLAWTLPYLGLTLGGGWIHQSFTRPNDREIRRVFGVESVPDRDGFAARFLLLAGLELPFSRRFVMRIEAGGGASSARTEHAFRVLPAALARISGGVRF